MSVQIGNKKKLRKKHNLDMMTHGPNGLMRQMGLIGPWAHMSPCGPVGSMWHMRPMEPMGLGIGRQVG